MQAFANNDLDSDGKLVVRGCLGVQASSIPGSASSSVHPVPMTMRTGTSRLEGCPFCGLQLDDSVALVAHCETVHSVVQGYISVH